MQSLGFNAVRLPFCPATIHGAAVSSVDYTLNPDLAGLDSQRLFDTVVARLEARGMYFLLDHHRPDCQQISELWTTSTYSEAQWIADLQFVAERYKADAHFLGMDLKNEPHGAATWGTGNAATDWNSAAQRAGAAVLAKAPDILVFVEGITQNNYCTASAAGTWWGGNLGPQNCKPLNLPVNHLVLSPHVYGPDVYEQSYFNTTAFPANLPAIWDANFGSLAAAGYTVIVGETGGKYGTGDPKDKAFQDALIAYLEQRGIYNLFYWCWNPNSGDTGGILNDDWTTVRDDKMALLRGYWASAPTNAPLAIVVSNAALVVPEGGTATVAVSLSGRPAANVTVGVARNAGGDADLSVAASSLLFTPANYATAQPLVLRAAEDADATNGSAVFTLSAAGATPATITATEKDNDAVAPACALAFDTSNDWGNGQVLSVTLNNAGTVPISNWAMTWTESNDVTPGSAWNATIAKSGRVLTATPLSYNATVAPRASIAFGLVLSYAGAKPLPAAAGLAGLACTVSVK
jgi:aryl-phospho-beta-D-glucosidase BglC (GH1 family)